MKAFEVKIACLGGSKNESKLVFVMAASKNEVGNCEGVLKVWERKNIQPHECAMEIKYGAIVQKETRGGPRPGAGRPVGEETKVITFRVKLWQEEAVRAAVKAITQQKQLPSS